MAYIMTCIYITEMCVEWHMDSVVAHYTNPTNYALLAATPLCLYIGAPPYSGQTVIDKASWELRLYYLSYQYPWVFPDNSPNC